MSETLTKKTAYLQTFRKFQLVGWLEDYYTTNELPEGVKITKIRRMNTVDVVNFMFENIPAKDLPNITTEFINEIKSKYTSSAGDPKKRIAKKKGIKPLTEEEQDLLEMEDDFSDFYKGKTPIKPDDKGKFNITTLQEHQKRFMEGFIFGNIRSGIVFHGVGTGKTITAISAIRLYLQLYKKNKVYIVTPPAVLFNFVDSLIQYGINPTDKRIEYYSYVKFANANLDLKNSMLVIDEAHNLRTEIQPLPNDVFYETGDNESRRVSKGIRPYKILLKTENAHKVILLTATPFVNTPYDIENLISIGESKTPLDPETFGSLISDFNNLVDYFKYRISYYMNEGGSEFFPEMREKYVSMVYDRKSDEGEAIEARTMQFTKQEGVVKNSFYSKSRVKSLDDDKFKFCVDIIKKNPTKKYVLYTSFLENGVSRLGEYLKEIDTPFGVVSGTKSTFEKKTAIDAYNNFENPNWEGLKHRVLVITKAGAEGVSLRASRGIFVLDGVWNEATYEQIVARAIRFKSHYHLPKEEQFVEVYKLFSCYPSEKKVLDDINKGGNFDFQQYLDKVKEDRKALKAINKILEEQNKGGKITKAMYQNALKKVEQRTEFSEAKLATLKKGSQERRDYLAQQKEFDKKKARFETDENLKALQGSTGMIQTPSTDFFMFILQKSKFLKVEKLIRQLSDVPRLEDSIYGDSTQIVEVRKFYDSLMELKDNPTNLFKKLQNYLLPLAKKGSLEISRNIKNESSDIYQYILQRKEIRADLKAKLKNRINQEFFTPDDQVKELLNLAGLLGKEKKDTGFLSILEPSAGMGNIVNGVLSLMAKKKISIKIDAVEIVNENRNELIELSKKIPTLLNVMEQPDFLKFFPSKDYDYILMNPPFHLQKNNKNKLIRDVFDYDFVKRAYSMLDVNGVLCAITGRKWMESKEAKDWYKSVDAELYNKVVEWKGVKKGMDIKALKMTYIRIKKFKNNPALDREIQKIKFYEDEKDAEETNRNDIETNEEHFKILAEAHKEEQEYLFDSPDEEEEKPQKEEEKIKPPDEDEEKEQIKKLEKLQKESKEKKIQRDLEEIVENLQEIVEEDEYEDANDDLDFIKDAEDKLITIEKNKQLNKKEKELLNKAYDLLPDAYKFTEDRIKSDKKKKDDFSNNTADIKKLLIDTAKLHNAKTFRNRIYDYLDKNNYREIPEKIRKDDKVYTFGEVKKAEEKWNKLVKDLIEKWTNENIINPQLKINEFRSKNRKDFDKLQDELSNTNVIPNINKVFKTTSKRIQETYEGVVRYTFEWIYDNKTKTKEQKEQEEKDIAESIKRTNKRKEEEKKDFERRKKEGKLTQKEKQREAEIERLKKLGINVSFM